MKKICILQNSMTVGGTDTFVINLCRGLVRDGYHVTVVLSVDSMDYLPREGELKETGACILKTCSLRGIKSKIQHLKMLYHILKDGEYDVFQTNIDLFNGPQMFAAWLAGVPIRECHSHNAQQGCELSQGRTLPVRIYQKVMRWLCWTFSNRRGGCSEQAMDFLFLNRWKNDANSKVIHNGIDLEVFKRSVDREQKKAALGVTAKYVVCTVGRISFQKNPQFLLDIFYQLSQIRNDVDLVWCGMGEEESDICSRITQYGIENRVHLLGGRSDIPEILGCSDIFLLPSRFEGLGIVLIEAQAANLQCVISDVIPSEADCGLCVALPLDISAEFWAQNIDDILNGKQKMSLNQKRISEYSIDHMVEEMEEVFA